MMRKSDFHFIKDVKFKDEKNFPSLLYSFIMSEMN